MNLPTQPPRQPRRIGGTVLLTADGPRRRVLLDRPEKRNALDESTLRSLLAVLEDVRGDAEAGLVVLASTSTNFSAGADLNDWAQVSPDRAAELSRLGNDAFTALASLPLPTLAVLQGAVVGGGLELALACDVKVAASSARLGFPEARLGSLPSWGGVPRLVAAVGAARARHLLLTSDLLDGDTAAQWGLVGTAVPDDQLADEVERLSLRLLGSDPAVVALAQDLLMDRTSPGIEAALAARTAVLPSSLQRKQSFLQGRAEGRERDLTTGDPRPTEDSDA